MTNGESDPFLKQTDGPERSLMDTFFVGVGDSSNRGLSLPEEPMRFENPRTRLTTLANEVRHDGPAGATLARTLDEFGDFADRVITDCNATLNH
ncbi:hypothetical protein [Streptomyces brasiliscabiei]|uniref:hypothetical protein n=1 Tax=Streptomyces brasiliscabiei TaxID=2736302 RepID=UPI001C120C13|nr:hypothetical protein [Streptomyces brasiliscabiei]